MIAAVLIQARSASCRAAADRWSLTSARTSAEVTERTMATSIVAASGLITATAISGSVISRTGHYKVFPVAGAVLAGGGMLAISRLGATSPVWVLAVLLAVAGAGLGFFVQVSVLAGQNAVDYSLLGVATGALNFFKTMGGAFGAALFGAILAAGLAGRHATAQAYLHGYQTVFFWTVPFMVLALVLSLVMREEPLSDHMLDVAAGKTEVPEY